MSRCPSEQQLAQLLEETLSAAVREEVELHLAACAACQQILRHLSEAAALPAWQHLWTDVLAAEASVPLPFLDRLARTGPRAAARDLTHLADHGALTWSEEASQATPPPPQKPRLTPAATPLPHLDGYDILEEIGRGGMGVVYKARHRALGRVVALKMMPTGALLGAERRARFHTEAEAAARLQHPHIVQVYEVGWLGECPYYTMEYVAGGNLAQRLQVGRLSPREAAELVEKLARAVQHAHDHGIIHRDLKPGNVLLQTTAYTETEEYREREGGRGRERESGSAGRRAAPIPAPSATYSVVPLFPKITDFGLAKLLADDTDLTRTGDILGTPPYMAPEQASGRNREVGPATDIYALGALLYCLVTGVPPFDGATAADVLQSILTAAPVRPRSFCPALPRDLETICLKCLEKHPQRRYASALDLADELRRHLDGKPIRSRAVGPGERLWRWVRRRPALATLLLLVGLGATLGLPGVTLLWLAAAAARDQAREAQALEAVQRHQAEAALYSSSIARAQLEWQGNNVAEAEQLLERCPEEFRGWEWSYLHGLSHASLFTRPGHTGWVNRVAYSPDGRLLASAGGGNIFAIYTSQPVRPGEVILWDAATGAPVRSLRGHGHVVYSVAFRADGKQVVSTSEDATARVWDVATGELLLTLPHSEPLRDAVFSPDGRLLATAGCDRVVRVWELRSLEGRQSTSAVLRWARAGHTCFVRALVFSPDGRSLVSGSRATHQGEIKVWDVATGQEVFPIEATEGVESLALSSDGRWLAGATWEQGVKLWDLTTGRLVRAFMGHVGPLSGVAFSPDGRYLASTGSDATVRVWRVRNGQEALVYRGHLEPVRCVAFHPNGSRVASAGMKGSVKVWDLTARPDGTPVRIQDQDDIRNLEALAFTASGQELLVLRRAGLLLRLDAETHTLRSRRHVAQSREWLAPGEPACLSRDGSRLAGISAGDQHTAVCWDTATGRQLSVLRGHAVPLRHVTLDATGQRTATTGAVRVKGQLRGEVRVWDVERGESVWELTEDGLEPTRLALSPDGTLLALACRLSGGENDASTGQVRLIDLKARREADRLSGFRDRIGGLRFSPDGTRLAAVGAQQSVAVWDLHAGTAVRSQQGAPSAEDVAFTPCGRRLAVAGRSLVKILDAATGEQLLVLRSQGQADLNTGYNPRVCFSPDGRQLAAICNDNADALAVWSLQVEAGQTQQLRLARAERRAVVRHLYEAGCCMEEGNGPALDYHLRCLQARTLEGPWEFRRRATLHFRLGRWDQALADSLLSALEEQ